MSQSLGSKYIDITPLISERLGVFPGDVRFQREVSLDFKKGHHLLLSSIRTTLHLGAHADGPNHYSKDGVGINARDLGIYMGRCLVIHVSAPKGRRVSLQDLPERFQSAEGLQSVQRVLVRTGSFPDPDNWNSDFCSFDPSLIEHLAKAGVKLIGIDTPSIDPEDSKALESHQMVARYDLAILEGIVLDQAAEGFYTLMALPLKLEGADAAPVRAILFKDPELLGR